MLWFLLTALAGLIVIAGAVMLGGRYRPTGLLLIVGAAVAWVVMTFFLSLSTVDAGHIGLVRAFGNYVGTQDPGVNFKAPWQSVVEADVRIQSQKIVMDGRIEKGTGSAVSKETQPVYAVVTLNFQVLPNEVLDLYKTVGAHYFDAIIEPRVQQVFKSQTVNYSTVDVAPNRESIRQAVQETLDAQLEDYGIQVTDFLINNLDFAEAFVNAITAKQVATQTALAAQAKVAQAKAEAEQAVETARGQAESTAINAKGEADAIRIKGAALRQNPQVLQLTAIEKINPTVQTIYLPSTSKFLLNLNR